MALSDYTKFKHEFVDLCAKYGFQNGYFNISADNKSCFQDTICSETSEQDEEEVQRRVFKGLIPYILNSYESLIYGELDMVRVLMDEADRHRRICYEFRDIDKEDCPEVTNDADALTTIYMDKSDFELMKVNARHFRDKKGVESEEALRKAINIWADMALGRLYLPKNPTVESINRDVKLRTKLRKSRDEHEKDKVLKNHLGEPLEWK